MPVLFILYLKNNALCLPCGDACKRKIKQHLAAYPQAVNSFAESVILSPAVRTFAAAKVLPFKSRH
jgi:hypothetical protein